MEHRIRLAGQLIVLTALGMALGTTIACGQTIETPDKKPIPNVFLPAPIEPDPVTGRIPIGATRSAWGVWVAYADYKPRVRWESKPETPAVFGSRPFAFLEKSYVLMRYQGSDGHEYLLLASGKPKADLSGVLQPLGWVPRDYVIDQAKAQAAGTGGVLAKAMLINDLEMPGAIVDDKQIFQDAVWTQGIPSALDDTRKQTAFRRKQYALFNIFWIFARTPNGPITSSASDRDQAWILIGNAPGITIEPTGADDSVNVVQGWVPESRALLWLTREALAWDQATTMPKVTDRRQVQGLLYKTADDAYAASYPDLFRSKTGLKVPAETMTVGNETMKPLPILEGPLKNIKGDGWISAGYQPHHMRMPRLDWPRAGSNSKERTKFLPKEADDDNELIRIGSISGYDGLSAEQVADQNKKLDAIGQLTETTEILIVIDDTISMGKHFEAVAQAVEKIQADASNLEDRLKREGGKAPLIRAAVSYYNDTDGRPPGVKPYETMALRPVAEFGASIAQSVREHKTNNGGDIPEMALNGLAQAITDAKFSPFARKLVVLIGDVRDKSDPNDPTPAESVGRLFRPSTDSPIEFISIQVVPPGQSDEAAGFDIQMRRLAGYLKKNRGANLRTLGTTLSLEGGNELSELLSKGYNGVRDDAERIRREIDQIRAGDFSTDLSDDTKKILAKFGINVDEIRRRSRGKFQIYRPGYVWRLPKNKDGTTGKTPQVRDVVLLNEAEINTLTASLSKLVDFHDQRKNNSATKDALKDLILALIGDMYPKDTEKKDEKESNPLALSFQDAMRRKLGLSLNSTLLATIPKDGQVDVSFQDIEDIVWKVQKLNDIVHGVERKWTTQKVNEITVYIPGAVDPQPNVRGFTIPGSPAVWYWLDAKDEIP